MAKVIIEQFNPVTKNWNRLYEVEEEKFDENEPYKMDKYGGPYRVQYPKNKKTLDKPIYDVVDMEDEDGLDESEEEKPLAFSNFSNISSEDVEEETIY